MATRVSSLLRGAPDYRETCFPEMVAALYEPTQRQAVLAPLVARLDRSPLQPG